MIDNFDTNTETTTEEKTTEVGFAAASDYRAMRKMRPQGAAQGIPFKTTVNTLLLNGAADVYKDYIAPVLSGDKDHGSLAANEAVIGIKIIEYDNDHDKLLMACRQPKSGINALTVGRKVREIAAETYRLEKRSFVATGLLTDQS
jgi:hypothetical protein